MRAQASITCRIGGAESPNTNLGGSVFRYVADGKGGLRPAAGTGRSAEWSFSRQTLRVIAHRPAGFYRYEGAVSGRRALPPGDHSALSHAVVRGKLYASSYDGCGYIASIERWERHGAAESADKPIRSKRG